MHSERGDIIAMGLLKTVAVVGVVLVLLFELGAVMVNYYQVDSIGSEAVRAGLSALRGQGGTTDVQRAVEGSLAGYKGAALEGLTVDKNKVTVTVSREAGVLFLDRISPLQSVVEAHVTKSGTGL